MAELISHEPLRHWSHPSEGEMPAEQTGEIVREAAFARKDGGSESAPGSPGRFHERMGGGATWGASRLCTVAHAVGRGGI
jgi:hypothetical protein